MSRVNDLGLTKEQAKLYDECYKKAKEYFNLPKGWVLHHKDPTLQYTDLDRYIHWYIEDLQPMTKSEHRRFHSLYDNPMNYEKHRMRVSKAKTGKPVPNLQGGKHPGAKPVRCVTTNEVFSCIKDAVEHFGFTSHSAHCKIAYVCNGDRPHYKKLVFEWI